jgi:3-oxoadipate enol-lactonase
MRLARTLDGPEDAPLLVLSPSLGTTAAVFWDGVLPAFAERFRVLRHDLPGHGESPPPDGPVRVEDVARGVLALVDELGAERFSVCGVSVGGMVGMWLGANAADRVDRAALCCTGARLGTREGYFERAELVRREGLAPVVATAPERWFASAFAASPEARRIIDDLAAIPPEGYAACCEAVAEWDFRGDLGRVKPGTLVLFGAHDPLTTPEVRETLLHGIRAARSATLANASHLANVEQPQEFAAAVLRHLEGHA